MPCKVHEAIIALGFREIGKKAGASCYQRGIDEVCYKDHGPNRWQPLTPDSNRYTMRHLRNGKVLRCGTAWYGILGKIDD